MMKKLIKFFTLSGLLVFCGVDSLAQAISGYVTDDQDQALSYATVYLKGSKSGAVADEFGYYSLKGDFIDGQNLVLVGSFAGFTAQSKHVTYDSEKQMRVNFSLKPDNDLDEIVISSSLKPMLKSDSAVPIEIYTPKFFQKNPTASLFDAIKMVNGVQPQLNCNVCNTGDIHINGMEGAYTMVLIDGMPIVSSLASVYGLSGIPTSMIQRVEVVKGPASSLYGTEAMGGIINVITKDPQSAPLFSFDAFMTSWLETNLDVSSKFKLGKNIDNLLGVNYFKYGHRHDKNNDGFTDVTQQDRVSIFNKTSFKRSQDRLASIALRYLYEDRWGGETNWNKHRDRGGEQVYGESIFTNRFEAIGMYQIPTSESIFAQFSYNYHGQNSFYGPESYQAKQQVVFGQLYWDKQIDNHNILAGVSYKYTYYDDNTRATGIYDENGLVKNTPMNTPIWGLFIQDQWKINPTNTLLYGYRLDYDRTHKLIHSPRVAYKFDPTPTQSLRASFGTGFRVVNVFTEDHRALTGARQVVFASDLKPEESYNFNLNYVWKLPTNFGVLNFDATGFYTYFTNKIDADTDSDQTKIIYDNLDGHAVSKGISLNIEASFEFPLRIMAGATYMEVYREQTKVKSSIYHSPKWSGTFLASYDLGRGWSTDFTSNWNGPMRMPRVEDDYRPEYSPWVLLSNLQISKNLFNGIGLYGGVKNIFNTLPKHDAIARWWDPFGEPGNGVAPPPGRNDVIFEPNDYSYTPMLGRQVYFGVRYSIL
ncbi:TonB-dependent receptor [Myroides sp. LJL119]